MQADWQIPRISLLWLLVSMVVVIGLHVEHLPIWLLSAALLAVVWQIQNYRGAWGQPGKHLKVLLTGLCFGGVLSSYSTMLGLDPMVALLVSGFVLKLLEINHRRDALVIVYLAYFVAIVQCLFEQTMMTALPVFIAIMIVTAALVGLHQSNQDRRAGNRKYWFRPLQTSVVLVIQALPLMLVLFIVMPRIGALWSVPRHQDSGITGVSDSMSPGDFSNLSASREVAFRVEFEGDIPPQPSLYWRGLVFSEFDGRRWTQSGPWGYRDKNLLQWHGDQPAEWDSQVSRHGQPLAYTVMLEPTNSPWLFALPTARPDSSGVALTRDFRLYNKLPVNSEKQYRVRSWLDYDLESAGLTPLRRRLELALPDGFNPETRRVAKRWRAENPDPVALINRLLKQYNSEFIYTLKPPLLGKHTVDEFLWGTKRGFCEFFASSFVFFMRAAGIPARVVVGYQGGERHPNGDYLLVHQYDAHAWAEVWLKGRGWLRVDPTAAVAPERVEMSFTDLFGKNKDFLSDSLLSLERYQHISWLNKLRLNLDALDYAWTKWVLGYDHVQTDLLMRLLGRIDPMRIGMLLVIAGAIALAPMAIMLFRAREKHYRDELDQQYVRFCLRMERAGLARLSGEGPRDYAKRIVSMRPELQGDVTAITDLYEAQRYKNEQFNAGLLRQKMRRFYPGLRRKVRL